MKTLDRHPLYYWTLPARQNARWALARKLRTALRQLGLIVVGLIVAALAAYGLVAIAAQVLHFFVMP